MLYSDHLLTFLSVQALEWKNVADVRQIDLTKAQMLLEGSKKRETELIAQLKASKFDMQGESERQRLNDVVATLEATQ